MTGISNAAGGVERRRVRPSSAAGVGVDTWWATRRGLAAVAARQRRRLADLVRHARARSPLYAEVYRDVAGEIVDVRQLPPVTKTQLMERFDDWVCDRAVTRAGVDAFIADHACVGGDFLGRYVVWTTSGTSGIPAILVQDRVALAVYTAVSVVRGYVDAAGPARFVVDVARVARCGGRVATLLVTGGHHGGAVMVARSRRRHPRLADRNRLLSVLRPLAGLVAELNGFQPAVLHGYPSALALLAAEQHAGRLHVDPVVMGATGETLTPAARHRIESAFGCRVRDAYGSSEAGGIAFECARRRLHVNADWVIVEPVDHDHRPVAPGVASDTMLVTNLANRVQPIIRYDLGDSVTWHAARCACASPLPSITVHGRSDELLTLPGRRGDIRVVPLAVSTVAEDTPGVQRVQIVKTGPSHLTIHLETTPAADSDHVWRQLARRLTTWLTGQGAVGVEVTRSGQPPSAEVSGKYRQVWTRPGPPSGPADATDLIR